MNPCACGNPGRSDRPCGCTPATIAHYRARVSGPLLDRFDVQVEIPPLPLRDFQRAATGERSEVVAARVTAAVQYRALDRGRCWPPGADSR
ncbi:MAG: ATP-binding protein [Candidatus Rokubacteria bacterium]|nr:ATP-binding protein [Candidatus Rokubacteria bacterium]